MLYLLGIRHHGPGSAQNIKAALEEIKPDMILVEGPPEGEAMLKHVIHPEMKPPVALLAYQIDMPSKAVFYPFAEFSPEWQALTYGVYNNIPINFFDLPLVHKFAFREEIIEIVDTPEELLETKSAQFQQNEAEEKVVFYTKPPLQYIAEAAGFSDYDEWWEQTFEQRKTHDLDYFEAIKEMMTLLRASIQSVKTTKKNSAKPSCVPISAKHKKMVINVLWSFAVLGTFLLWKICRRKKRTIY